MKTKINKLDNKVPDATTLIHINQYNTDKQNLEKKTGDVDKKYQKLVVTTVLNTINSGLTKKTDYNTKISEINKKIFDHNHHKYITTGKFNKLMADNFAARLKQASLATKTDIDDFVEKTDLMVN